MTRSFYFDMDGVLVRFDDACDKSVVLAPGGHYFRTCPADERAVSIAKCLSVIPETRIHVLTRLFGHIPRSLKLEQEADKRGWCEEHLDFRAADDWSRIDISKRFLCTDSRKSEILDGIPIPERKSHVLVDDDPEILSDWARAGGTGIQYVQPGHEMPVWYGARILAGDSVPSAIRKILYAAFP